MRDWFGFRGVYRWAMLPVEELAGVVFVWQSARALKRWESARRRHGAGPLHLSRRPD